MTPYYDEEGDPLADGYEFARILAEMDKWRSVITEFVCLAMTVQRETEGYRHGTPCYDIIHDHLWEVADTALARYREAAGA